jgi:hypothetical protein
MKTGEGKTLVATLPAYLNALTGQGVHVVTVNDYLAKRDAQWMGKIYRFLGMSVGCVVNGMEREEKQAAYNADITYGTNNEFGFDYLRDNMVVFREQMVQRDLSYDHRRGGLHLMTRRARRNHQRRRRESSEMYSKRTLRARAHHAAPTSRRSPARTISAM